jgi:glucose-1-phosphate thymidylyltransferase
MWGIIPAAGAGTRIQPLAFSKELPPICGGTDADDRRPRAVSDYLVERLVLGGATKIRFVISAGKSDILEYYGGSAYSAAVCYAVQPKQAGLCDAIFRALPVIDKDAPVLIGLPDTIWFPKDAIKALPEDRAHSKFRLCCWCNYTNSCVRETRPTSILGRSSTHGLQRAAWPAVSA